MDAFFEEQLKRLDVIFAQMHKVLDESIEGARKLENDAKEINRMLEEIALCAR